MIGNNAIIAIVVVSGIIAIVLAIIDAVLGKSTIITWIWGVSAGVCIFMAVSVGITCSRPCIQDDTPYLTRYIHSLEDNNLTTGKGYYRSVRINTDLYYQFLYKDGVGYTSDRVQADNTSVIEDTSTPRVEYYNKRQKWFVLELTKSAYKIYIPPTSIKQKYNIDLE